MVNYAYMCGILNTYMHPIVSKKYNYLGDN